MSIKVLIRRISTSNNQDGNKQSSQYQTPHNAANQRPIKREAGGDTLITVHLYSGGVGCTRQVSAPVVKDITEGRHCLKANVGITIKGICKRVG